jgi:hypothetical protein
MRRTPSSARPRIAVGMAAALIVAPALADDALHGGSLYPLPEGSFAALSAPDAAGLHPAGSAARLDAEMAGPHNASPLPEPATWPLVAAGCALVIYVARRRGG